MHLIKQILLVIWNLPVAIESTMSTDTTLARILFIVNIPVIISIPARVIGGYHVAKFELALWCIILLYQCHWYKCLDMPWQRNEEDHDKH